MKVVVMQVKASAMGKPVTVRLPNGNRRTTRNGRAYVRVTLGIFLGDDETEALASMGTALGDRIEVAVEQAVNTFKAEPKPTRKIVMKGTNA